MMTCEALDRLVTCFVDGECSERDRAAVIAHIRECRDCRVRIEAESTAKHVLHAHASVARTLGVPVPWRPRVWRLGKPLVPLHPAVLLLVAITGAGVLGFLLQPAQVLAVGVIGDSFCEHHHRPGRPNADDRECTLGCVKRGAEFVLVTDTQIYRIRNQQLPELTAFANQRVKVQGTVEDGRIVVGTMTVVEDRSSPAATRVQ